MLSNSHSNLPYVSLQECQNKGFGPLEKPKWKQNKAYIILREKEEIATSIFDSILHIFITLYYYLSILTTFCWIDIICILRVTHLKPKSFSNLPVLHSAQVDRGKTLLSINPKKKRRWNHFFASWTFWWIIYISFIYYIYVAHSKQNMLTSIPFNVFFLQAKYRIYSYIIVNKIEMSTRVFGLDKI